MTTCLRSFALLSFLVATTNVALAAEYLNGIKWTAPAIVTPGKTDDQPPSDAVVLFDGTDFSKWENGERWSAKDGIGYAGKGKIVSKDKFGDCQIHVEWASPETDKGKGQGRGNSGIFMMGIYEIQVLDSYENETCTDMFCESTLLSSTVLRAIYTKRPRYTSLRINVTLQFTCRTRCHLMIYE